MPLNYLDDGPVSPDHPINQGLPIAATNPGSISASQERPLMQGADKYHGAVVDNYEDKRSQQPRWIAEQNIIETALDVLPNESVVLDVPIGTGRFFEAIRRSQHKLIGVDVSDDMLKTAQSKIQDGDKTMLIKGPVWQTGLDDQSVDVSVMCRLTRWLNPDERKAALMELQRVTKTLIILTARVRNHDYSYTYDDINEAIDGGTWAAAWDYGAHEEDYRVLAIAKRTSGWFGDGEQIGLPIEAT